jgi:hypothetical protein
VAALPLTVTSVVNTKKGLWAVTVALFDGRVETYLVPDSMATLEAVRVSALAMGQLLGAAPTPVRAPHHLHPRYAPRT